MKFLLATLCLTLLIGCSQNQSELARHGMSGLVEIFNIPNDNTANTTPKSNNPQPVSPPGDKNNDEDKGGLGSGFIVAENIIVTNYHVIKGNNNQIKVLGFNDMKAYSAHVIAGDADADLAVIKLDEWDDFSKNIKPHILKWGSSRNVNVGDTVWSMGNPYGLSWTVAQGLVSHKLRTANNRGNYYIQTTTAIYPGNSGGPLLNSMGDVIAVNSAIVGREGYFGMAIPSDYAHKVVTNLLDSGMIHNAKMGLRLSESNDHHWIRIVAIEDDCTCINAGLLPNDEIAAVRTPRTQGRWVEVKLPDQLISEVMMLEPNDLVDIDIIRDRSHRVISFPVRERSDP
jgi:S1-C subfamily serine protease